MARTRKLPPDLQFWRSLLRNASDLWFTPEIEKRISAGQLTPPARIWAAQVIMEPGQPPRVFLNDELQGVFAATFKDPAYQPELNTEAALDQIKAIHSVTLTEAFPNAGHLTVIWHKSSPFIAFDFRRNAARIDTLCARASEFHAAARGAFRRRHYSAFVENLFAEVELLAKAILGTDPEGRVLKARKHHFIKNELNRSSQHGNVPPRFAALHNRLADIRNRARYGAQSFTLDLGEARRMLRCARGFSRYVDQRRPRRWKEVDA